MGIFEKPLTEIKIKKHMLRKKPDSNLMNKLRKKIKKSGYIGEILRINQKGFLEEGYEAYLVLKENNVESALITIVDKKWLEKRNSERNKIHSKS